MRAGQHPNPHPKARVGLLGTAHDWQMKADLETQVKFLKTVAETTLRADILLVSKTSRRVFMPELTVPFEERN